MSAHVGLSTNSVLIAEQLLDLVKSVATPSQGNTNQPAVDPLAAWNAKAQIQALCDKLIAQTLGPLEYTAVLAESCQESQALQFATSLGIADIIGDGEETLSSLSEKVAVQPQFLGVVMNCLLGRGYFEEVGKFGSHVYKNNQFSHVLRDNHESTLKSAIGLSCDEAYTAASYLLDAAKSATVDKSAPQKKVTAMNLAFGFEGSVFEWMSSPEQAWRAQRVGKAMKQLHQMANSNLTEDYPWDQLACPIVDVGGGIGSLEMSLMKVDRYNHLNFILFDLPGTVANARKEWASLPSSFSERVTFVGGSFMAATVEESNLPQGKPTYIIRHVLLDWTDDDVVLILSMVRQAMGRQGRLLLVDMLLHQNSSRFVRTASVQLLALNSGVTRTQDEMEMLLKRAGFKVEKVTHVRAASSVIEAVIE